MMSILSTRSLDKTQMSMLKNAGISIETYDAISITHLNTEIPTAFSHYIFTSKNGVRAYLKNRKEYLPHPDELLCYCVGEKTKSLLEEKGLKVVKMTNNASELAHFIVNESEKGPFLVFTGNRNRPDLGNILRQNGISFREIKGYETHLNPHSFECEFSCILFYSPSGINSFLTANKPGNSMAICIGETTAKEARKHFIKVKIADKATTDAVLDKLIEIYPTLAIT
ncbi:uroporphyrinogen-III synthase [Muriicola sp. SD30]|uniref:uroporphyrinogen-III synthase n=1 Tax=Muriicola sp. SD30 TaxID=3240936 RepID=UPI00350F11AA